MMIIMMLRRFAWGLLTLTFLFDPAHAADSRTTFQLLHGERGSTAREATSAAEGVGVAALQELKRFESLVREKGKYTGRKTYDVALDETARVEGRGRGSSLESFKWLSVAVEPRGEGGGIWLEVSYTYRGEPIGDMHNLVERAIFEGEGASAPAAHTLIELEGPRVRFNNVNTEKPLSAAAMARLVSLGITP